MSDYSSSSDDVVEDSYESRGRRSDASKSKSNVVDLTIESSGAEESILVPKRNKKTNVLISSDDSDDENSSPQKNASSTSGNQAGRLRNMIVSSDSDEEQSPKKLDITARRSQGDVISEDGESEGSVALYDETDDDSDGEVERRALSPRTRMSMTGIRPKDLNTSSEIASDDYESEHDGEEDEEVKALSPRTRMSITGFRPKDMSSELIESDDGSSFQNKSNDASFKSAHDESSKMELHSFNAEAPPIVQEDTPTKSPKGRYTAVFNQSIKDKLSSTLHDHREEKTFEEKDSSLIMMSPKKSEVIELSSSNEENPVPRMIQPKITATVSKMESKYVSQDFHDKELLKLEELKQELATSEKLIQTIGSKLPDGGFQIKKRIAKLKNDIQTKASVISSYVIEEGYVNRSTEIKAQISASENIPNWNDLANDVNRIQPIHTGRQGLATFNNQKTLTIDTLKVLHGSLATCPPETVLIDNPKGLKVELMDHQRHALAWMMWRESQKPRGGILADDMGLGKTLTMISLVVHCNNLDEEKENESEESDAESDNDDWGTKRRKDYYHGGTLVVCPASLILQWEKEANQRLKRDVLSVYVHHGNNRESKPRYLRKYDLVITTYNICSREAKTGGTLFGVKWRRVILDEAHVVRNHKSQMCVGVCQLKSKFRWTLTGTPIQNKEMDMYALLKFLRCSPFDDLTHWKQWIDNKSEGGQKRLNTLMKSLMLRRTKVQLQERGALQSLPNKATILIDVALDKEEMNVYQKIMVFSRTLFAQFLHQRAERNNDIYYKSEGFKPTYMQAKDPNGAYHKLHEKFSRMHHGKEEVKSSQILVLLLRLRQICCHPGLIDAMLEDDLDHSQEDSLGDGAQADIDLLEQLKNLEINDEENTAEELIQEVDKAPNEDKVSKASAKVLMRSNPVYNLQRASSKMLKVLEVFEEKVKSTDKAIIISQWTSVLNLLKTQFSLKRIPFLSLDGTVPVKDRQKIVNEINDPRSDKRILFLSLTAGGVGLNLIGANHLFLFDLHWNPQLEAQAQDRIYRVGQKKDVFIYKFMCVETVEERIKVLQEKKLAIAEGVLTGSKTAGSKLTIEDLKTLFNM